MGTNYYLKHNECEHCGRYDRNHIGKSSAGWAFSLHVTDEFPDLEAWMPALEFGHIVDEYGHDVSYSRMMNIIKQRRHLSPSRNITSDFLWRNHAIVGNYGLLFSEIDGIRCVGHGETWSLITREFS